VKAKPCREIKSLRRDIRSAYFEEHPPYSQFKQSPPAFRDQFASHALSPMGWVDRHVSELGLVDDVVERGESRKCRRSRSVEFGHQDEPQGIAGQGCIVSRSPLGGLSSPALDSDYRFEIAFSSFANVHAGLGIETRNSTPHLEDTARKFTKPYVRAVILSAAKNLRSC
jgi:hypothetical protein